MKDLFDTAVEAGQFTTLLRLAELAGLTDTLRSEGPLTIFAPTDEAFASLPQEKKTMLQQPENRDKLCAILTYHVVPGKWLAAAILEQPSLTTIQGGELKAKNENGSVWVNRSRVVTADLETTNGVIHVIDRVLLPCECEPCECEPCECTESEEGNAEPVCAENYTAACSMLGAGAAKMQEMTHEMRGMLTKAVRSGAADARTKVAQIVPKAGNIVSGTIYGACYAISYGVVFPTMLVVSFLPTNNSFCHGLVDGARAAGDSVTRLRTHGVKLQRPNAQPVMNMAPAGA